MKKTLGEAVITLLEAYGVEMVFGIPGVHTVELYRGLAGSTIRHITPRHEGGAAFMADGYARAKGKPGVCFLITGPGLTNALTGLAQARADRVPMLVISSVNPMATDGHENGALHELPDQLAMMKTVALSSETLGSPRALNEVFARAFLTMRQGGGGPVHIQIPIDLLGQEIDWDGPQIGASTPMDVSDEAIDEAARRLKIAQYTVILAGGGARGAQAALADLAEKLDAPVITTVNARTMLSGHPLHIPASASLASVRQVIASSDLVLAVGTEFGPTDYDMYVDGNFPNMRELIRIDLDPVGLFRNIVPHQAICADAKTALLALSQKIPAKASAGGAGRARVAREGAWQDIGERYQAYCEIVQGLAHALPSTMLVGDSTQLVYAANCYAEFPSGTHWWNSATGFGSLGYGAPGAIGAKLADPSRPVICLTGDGGLQYSLAELGTAMDEKAYVIFLVWNNNGYQEIENYMLSLGITPVGVKPSAPDFVALAQSYGMSAERISRADDLSAAILRAHKANSPYLIELITH